MTTATHNYGWLMPDPGGSANTWGNTLNGTTQAIDAKLWSLNAQLTNNTLDIWRGPDGGATGAINFGNQGNTQLRWVLGETSETEGAGNTGTNFFLNAYDNTGTYLGQAFTVARATQNVTFPKAVTASSGLIASGVTSTNGGVLSQAQAGGDALFAMTNSSGTNMGFLGWRHTDNSIALTNQNGAGQIWITPDGLSHVNNTLEVSGDIWTYDGAIYNQAASGGNSNFWFVRNDGVNMGVVYYDIANEIMVVQNQIGGGQARIDGVGNFQINGNALKPGGGAWLATSDARIKTVKGSYSAGLDEIAGLNPVRFTYKGNDGDTHALVKGKEFVGLVADEAMRAMPELVSLGKGEIDGNKVSDLKMLDPSAIIYALINAVKDLKAEIEELKAAR